jgi:hypothetical protein
MVKFTPNDLGEAVSNLDEVETALRGTEVEWMLGT